MSSEISGAVWRKSSRSGQSGGQCVEVALTNALGAVRDSKNPAGPSLCWGKAELTAFLDAAKNGQFAG
jgi:hypothetical protein